jgi:UDP-GlcNAc:undecaprenyl-phosphate GlcNAc-1-phosphate transferase
MPFWTPFPIAAAFALSAMLTPAIMALAWRLKVVDEPTGGRKIHRSATPLMGGLAIFIGFFAPLFFILGFSDHLTSGQIGLTQYLGFFVGSAVLMAGGVLDDKRNLSPRYSVWFPVLAAFIASLAGIGVSKITNPLGGSIMVLPFASGLITFCWLVGMSYATKLLDGVDGLATSIGVVASLLIAALTLSKAFFQPDVALLSLLFGAALLGFLLWNFPTARIFLGEGGSTFLGFSLGVLAIIAGSKMLTLLLVLGVPCLDVLQVIIRRLWEGRSVTSGDRYHFHHLLFDAGFTERQVVFVYAGFSLLFGSAGLFLPSLGKIITLGVTAFLFLSVVVFLSRRKKSL